MLAAAATATAEGFPLGGRGRGLRRTEGRDSFRACLPQPRCFFPATFLEAGMSCLAPKGRPTLACPDATCAPRATKGPLPCMPGGK